MKQSLINEVRRCRPLLGTLVEITVSRQNEKQARLAVDEAFAIIKRVHALMSFHDPQSEISRLNRLAGQRPVLVSPETYRVLEFSKQLYDSSGGIFDVAVAPELMKQNLLPQHGFLKRYGRYTGKTCDIKLVFPRTVYFSRPLCLDVGGVAKGFAVDEAVGVLQKHGIQNGVVNAGGDLRCFGAQKQPVWVRHPQNPLRLLPLPALKNRALATSSDAYHRLGAKNRIYVHIHGQTRKPLRRLCSVSVCADSCMVADSLTKAVMAMEKRSAVLLKKFGATALIIYLGGRMIRYEAVRP